MRKKRGDDDDVEGDNFLTLVPCPLSPRHHGIFVGVSADRGGGGTKGREEAERRGRQGDEV